MKQVLFAIILIMMTGIFTGCKKVFPDGPAIKELRNVSDFEKIEAGFSGNVFFVQGVSKKVEVEAASNIQQYIITEVKNGTLRMRTQPNVNIRGGSVNIYVTNPTISRATLAGSGNISFNSNLSTSSLELILSGSGNISLPKILTNSLQASITGSGNISISEGEFTKQDIVITGNGDYMSSQIPSEESKVKITGSGNATVWVNNKLDITITGSGDVWYKGNPIINTTITGSGKVRKL